MTQLKMMGANRFWSASDDLNTYSGYCDPHLAEAVRNLMDQNYALVVALRDSIASLGGINSDNVPESARLALAMAAP